jgi:hypothetical protein
MIGRLVCRFGWVSTMLAVACSLTVMVLPAHADVTGPKTLCVGGRGCFPTIQLAVDAAQGGDTVKIGPGTFAGGVTIAKSITVVGAGAAQTTIRGGGPVVTIGDLHDVKRVVATLRALTITGGLNRGNVNWTPDGPTYLQPPWGPLGGGVLVDGADVTKAETVATIVDCVITRNRVLPAARSGLGSTPFSAAALGGGIANIGRLTLVRTTVSDNVAGGGVTTKAQGGGVWNATASGPGALTIRDSRITGNTALVSSNHAEKAEGGGIEAQDGLQTFVVTGSIVSGNRALLDTNDTSGRAEADAGGVEIGGTGKATITSTRITGNLARVIAPRGKPIAYASAIVVKGPDEKLTIRDVTITGNRTEANVLAAGKPGDPACCQGDVVEISSGGTLTRTTIAHNTNIARVQQGTLVMLGAVVSENADRTPLVFIDSVIESNSTRATNVGGATWAVGGGVANFGLMELRNTRVSGNTLTANGTSGFARGGGVLNGPGNQTRGRLTLTGGTVVTRNVLHGSRGIVLAGGGLYAGLPVKIVQARILGNSPDQCHGCRK